MIRRGNGLLVAAFALAAMSVASCGEPTGPSILTSPSFDPVAAATDYGDGTVLEAPSVQLVSCPTSATASAHDVIGVAGGEVSAGGVTIHIPPGAVLVPTVFDVTVPASEYMEVDITARGFEHYLFVMPVTVSIDYSRCDDAKVATASLAVFHIDLLTKTLLERMFGDDDKQNRRITFITDHLSGYAIAN